MYKMTHPHTHSHIHSSTYTFIHTSINKLKHPYKCDITLIRDFKHSLIPIIVLSSSWSIEIISSFWFIFLGERGKRKLPREKCWSFRKNSLSALGHLYYFTSCFQSDDSSDPAPYICGTLNKANIYPLLQQNVYKNTSCLL